MTKPAGQDAKAAPIPPATAAGGDLFGLAPWLREMPVHPLMADPVAAMAATTAIGFGIAGRMAELMLDMMQTATERTMTAPEDAAPEDAAKVARETATPKQAETRPVRKAPAAKADDLKAISGIGPKLEQVLNAMGIRRYADVAALTAADAARIEAELGLGGRIARDGWVEQARTLAKGRGRGSTGTGETERRRKERAKARTEAGKNGAGETQGTAS